jgi:hypothetical protein
VVACLGLIVGAGHSDQSSSGLLWMAEVEMEKGRGTRRPAEGARLPSPIVALRLGLGLLRLVGVQ